MIRRSFGRDNSTVASRMDKNGGFMTGLNHPLNRMIKEEDETDVEPMSDTLAEDEGGDNDKPPNLRQADSASESCGTCEHFAARKCTLHSEYPVMAQDVCDNWEHKELPAPVPGDDDDGDEQDLPMEDPLEPAAMSGFRK